MMALVLMQVLQLPGWTSQSRANLVGGAMPGCLGVMGRDLGIGVEVTELSSSPPLCNCKFFGVLGGRSRSVQCQSSRQRGS